MRKEFKTRFKEIDYIAAKKYNTLKSSFFGLIMIKMVGEIILAILIAIAVYFGTAVYKDISAVSVENRKIDHIYITISDEYIKEQFGTPYISFIDDSNLKNNFFVLEDAILRTVSDGEKVVAYFITATDKQRKIPVDSFEDKSRILGKTTYSELQFGNPEIEAFYCGDGRVNYYYEIQGTGRYGMYNYYVYGNTTYGFLDTSIFQLIQDTWFGTLSEVEEKKLKEDAMPNTFGVISESYRYDVSFLPSSIEWSSMYYLLCNKQK